MPGPADRVAGAGHGRQPYRTSKGKCKQRRHLSQKSAHQIKKAFTLSEVWYLSAQQDVVPNHHHNDQGRAMASSVYYPRTLTTPQDLADQFCPGGESSEDFRQRFLSANSSLTAQSRCTPCKPVIVPSADRNPSVCLGPLNACTAEQQSTLRCGRVPMCSAWPLWPGMVA